MTETRAADGRRERHMPAAAVQSFGLGCLMAWTYVTFFSRLVHFSTRNDIEHLNSTYTFACCGMVVAFLAYALVRRPIGGRRAGTARLPEALAAAALAACTVVLAMVEREFFKQPWCSIASVVAGMAFAVLALGWGTRLIRGPAGSAAPHIAIAFVFAAAAFAGALQLPELAGIALTALLPLASLSALIALDLVGGDATKGDASPALGTGPGGGPAAAGGILAVRDAKANSVFVRSLIALGLLSLAESLVRAVFLEVDPASETGAYRLLFLAAMCGAAGFLCAVDLRGPSPSHVRRLTRATMLLLAFLMLLSPIMYGLSPAADLPPLMCHCLFTLLEWAYLVETARAYRIEARVLFGLALAVSYAACLTGTFVGSVATSFFDLGERALSLSALACACLVLVSFLFIADEHTFTVLLDADDERPQTPRRFRLRVEEVARTHGLTAKETEVLMLAAKGRTTQRICEELGISTGTVNTHLMHIYKKLDVHDRQRMIDLLEARAADTEGGH